MTMNERSSTHGLKFPHKFCEYPIVNKNHHKIQGNRYNLWIDIKTNKINPNN